MALGEELERIAAAAGGHGEVTAVLAAEPALASGRVYLVSFGEEETLEWLVLDEEGRPLDRRETARATASIVVMCERAGDLAGGGHPAQPRARPRAPRLEGRPAAPAGGTGA